MAAQDTLKLMYKDDVGRKRRIRVWAEAGRGYRADFRAFADVNGGKEALIPPGEHWATGDPVLAQRLAQERLAELLAKRQAQRDGRPLDDPKLADYVERHLTEKATHRRIKGRMYKASTITRDRFALLQVVGALGDDARLSTLDVEHLKKVVTALRAAGAAERTVLNVLHSVSDLWTFAKHAKLVQGDNPVPTVKDIAQVSAPDTEAHWLETGEAARLLTAAEALDREAVGARCPILAPILATYLLTGGRKEEVLGLEVGDLDFEGGWVRFRPNRWRGLKSRHSARHVPLWPQLRDILTAYLARRPHDGLLFPSHLGRIARPYTDLGQSLGLALARAEITTPVTWHTLRHTYTSHRLYTVEGGAPVSLWTVACELGHHDVSLIENTYGHVLKDRDRNGRRTEEVRYALPSLLTFPQAAQSA